MSEIFRKLTTIHTSRTMMYAELSKVMDHAIEDDSYLNSLQQNIANKKTKSNQDKTTVYLERIYHFTLQYLPFIFFKYFWQVAPEGDKPILTLLYAVAHDYLLAESIPVISTTWPAMKVSTTALEENVQLYHPDRYSKNTTKSIAQNIASSWKQAGFITGKIKNIRTQPEVGYHAVAFAFLMAYLHGSRGDFIITGNTVKALCLNDAQIRQLAVEAGKRNLLLYQYAGNVTAISFSSLFNKLGIHGIQS